MDDCAATTAGNPIITIAASVRRILRSMNTIARNGSTHGLPGAPERRHELPRDLVCGKRGRMFRKHARVRALLEIVGIAKELRLAERLTEK